MEKFHMFSLIKYRFISMWKWKTSKKSIKDCDMCGEKNKRCIKVSREAYPEVEYMCRFCITRGWFLILTLILLSMSFIIISIILLFQLYRS